MSNIPSSTLNRGAQGAAAGTVISPGWGTLIGGLAGAGLGLFEGAMNDSNRRAARDAIDKAIREYGKDSAVVKNLLDKYYSGDYSLGTKDDVYTYRNELSTYNPRDYIYNDYEDFDKDSYNLQDYYDANRGNQINAAANAVQAAAAGAAIANAVVNKNSELGDEAYDRMTADRTFDYSLWKDRINLNQQQLDKINQGQQYLMSTYGDLASDYMTNEADKVQNYMDYYNNFNNNLLNARLSRAGTYL